MVSTTSETPEAKQYTSLTPAGIEVLYQSQPKRLYKVRNRPEDGATASDPDPLFNWWIEVPSVTTVLGILDKKGLPWWAQGIAVESVLELIRRGRLKWVESW